MTRVREVSLDNPWEPLCPKQNGKEISRCVFHLHCPMLEEREHLWVPNRHHCCRSPWNSHQFIFSWRISSRFFVAFTSKNGSNTRWRQKIYIQRFFPISPQLVSTTFLCWVATGLSSVRFLQPISNANRTGLRISDWVGFFYIRQQLGLAILPLSSKPLETLGLL